MTARLTNAECAALRALRIRYQTGEHPFTERELAHLHFLRWLVRSPGWDRDMDRLDEASGAEVPSREIAAWTSG